MADQFLAEIRIFGCNFAPVDWAFCNGQILPISQNTALFSLIGTYYGGDGTTNFALPNLQGIAPLQTGQGPGLTLRDLAETGGEQTVTLTQSEMPQHTHSVNAKTSGGSNDPGGNLWGAAGNQRPAPNFYSNSNPDVQMNSGALSTAGGSLPHNNMPPYLTLNFCIAISGIFPSRN